MEILSIFKTFEFVFLEAKFELVIVFVVLLEETVGIIFLLVKKEVVVVFSSFIVVWNLVCVVSALVLLNVDELIIPFWVVGEELMLDKVDKSLVVVLCGVWFVISAVDCVVLSLNSANDVISRRVCVFTGSWLVLLVLELANELG